MWQRRLPVESGRVRLAQHERCSTAFEQLQPAIYATLTQVPLARIDEVYGQAPRETIDVGIMEQARNVATIPADFGWSDIGSWAELWELAERDSEGNVARGTGRVADRRQPGQSGVRRRAHGGAGRRATTWWWSRRRTRCSSARANGRRTCERSSSACSAMV